MSLLKLKAKVNLTSEQDMEIQQTMDLGTIARSAEWVWKTIAIPYEQVYKIIEYNSVKSIVVMHDGEMIFTNEKFDSLFEKWNKLREEYSDFETKYNEDDETNFEQDED